MKAFIVGLALGVFSTLYILSPYHMVNMCDKSLGKVHKKDRVVIICESSKY